MTPKFPSSMLWFIGSQRVGHDWATELNWCCGVLASLKEGGRWPAPQLIALETAALGKVGLAGGIQPCGDSVTPTRHVVSVQLKARWAKRRTAPSSRSAGLCLVIQSCSTLCDRVDYSLPGSSVHGILQARIPEWVALPSSRGAFQLGDWTLISCIAGGLFTHWATWATTTGLVPAKIHVRNWAKPFPLVSLSPGVCDNRGATVSLNICRLWP